MVMRAIQTPYTPVIGHPGDNPIYCMQVLNKQSLLATCNGCELILWRLPDLRKMSEDEVLYDEHAMGYIESKNLLALASLSGGTITAFNTKSGDEADYDLPGKDEWGIMSFSPNGTLVALDTDSHGVQVWEWNSREKPVALQTQQRVGMFTFTHDGVYVATSQHDEIVVWETSSGQHWYTIKEDAYCIHFLPDRSLVIAKNNGQIMRYQYDKRYWYPDWKISSSDIVLQFAAPPDTTTITVLTEDSVTVLDAKSSQRCGSIKSDGYRLSQVAVIPQHRLTVAGSFYGDLIVWTI